MEEDSLDLSEFLLSEFVFPKLKSLIIRLKSYHPKGCIDLFLKSVKKLTDLEYLTINMEIEIPFSQWLSLCRTLLKLRYLFIFNESITKPFENSEYCQLFEINHSLPYSLSWKPITVKFCQILQGHFNK